MEKNQHMVNEAIMGLPVRLTCQVSVATRLSLAKTAQLTPRTGRDNKLFF